MQLLELQSAARGELGERGEDRRPGSRQRGEARIALAHFHLGPFHCYQLTHPEHIHEVLVRKAKKFRKPTRLKQVFGPDFEPTQYRMLLFGLGMVLLMIWKPRGLISFRAPSIFLRERRLVRADVVSEGHG